MNKPSQDLNATAAVNAILSGDFYLAQGLIAKVSDSDRAESLAANCFHDYLWTSAPAKTEADAYVEGFKPFLATTLKTVYDRYLMWQNLSGGAS